MTLRDYVEQEDAVFHYTTMPITLERILSERRLRMSVFGDFKDPYEYGFKFFSSQREGASDSADETTQSINRLLRFTCRVLCFCSNKQPTVVLKSGDSESYALSSGWQRSRMWSQYGDGHKGMCLVCSRENIQSYLLGISGRAEKMQADYVTYLEDFGFYPVVDNPGCDQDANACALEYIKNNFSLLFRKHIDYRDEAEFRVVILDPDRRVQELDVRRILKGIIVGDRIPEVYIPLIRQLCADLDIEVLQARWTQSDPKWVLKDC